MSTFPVARILGDTIRVAGHTSTTEDYLFTYTLPVMVGLVTGGVQALLLRRLFPHTGWGGWVGATVIGYSLPYIVVRFLPAGMMRALDDVPATSAAMSFGLIGCCLGPAQWAVLRRAGPPRRLPQAGWWIPITISGWAITGLVTGRSLGLPDVLPVALLPPIAACVGLWLLLRHPPRQGSAGAQTHDAARPSV